MHIHIDKTNPIGGFAAENARPGELAKIVIRASVVSDEPDFHKYVGQFDLMFLARSSLISNAVYQFLVVIHEDMTADLYINDFLKEIEMRAKRDIEKGSMVRQDNIADIRRVRFPDVPIDESDKVVYCFKAGWRFGLFFDLSAGLPPTAEAEEADAPKKLDVDAMERSIGSLQRELDFYDLYKSLATKDRYQEMATDGWFPFVEMLPTEYGLLSDLYNNKFDFENRLHTVIENFDAARIVEVTSKWWTNGHFEKGRVILQAGVNSYLQDNQEGFVLCIKTLGTEIEGLLRLIYREDTGKGDVKIKQLLAHIVDKGKTAAGGDYSLILALPFLEYLRDVIFADFDVDTGNIGLSRNTVGHGVAEAEQYTKSRALQMILIFDQIYFFSNGESSERDSG